MNYGNDGRIDSYMVVNDRGISIWAGTSRLSPRRFRRETSTRPRNELEELRLCLVICNQNGYLFVSPRTRQRIFSKVSFVASMSYALLLLLRVLPHFSIQLSLSASDQITLAFRHSLTVLTRDKTTAFGMLLSIAFWLRRLKRLASFVNESYVSDERHGENLFQTSRIRVCVEKKRRSV